jgi:BMFP domain-containing protein YqiC
MKFKKDTKAKLADLEERVAALENPETEQESEGS